MQIVYIDFQCWQDQPCISSAKETKHLTTNMPWVVDYIWVSWKILYIAQQNINNPSSIIDGLLCYVSTEASTKQLKSLDHSNDPIILLWFNLDEKSNPDLFYRKTVEQIDYNKTSSSETKMMVKQRKSSL